MQFKRLTLSGFKSFVDPAQLYIEEGLTGVVGPNGCGKSNLLEALRWVMGENSPKSMRGAGMEDVIFSGTIHCPARNFAEVTLTASVIPGEIRSLSYLEKETEIAVTRRIERGAGSAYRANGRDVRAKDISLIFADAATGAHSPALVSQGKISQIIISRTVERRQMLEEAAGITGLHVRRKDAEAKLRGAESNLERIHQIMEDMDNRARILRRQAQQAKKYRQLSKEIKQAEATAIFTAWHMAVEAAKKVSEEAKILNEQVIALQKTLSHAQTEYETQEQEINTHRAEAELLNQQVQKHEYALIEARHALQKWEQERVNHEAQIQRIAEDNARENQISKDAVQRLLTLQNNHEEQVNALSALKKTHTEIAERLSAAQKTQQDKELAHAHAMAEDAEIQADLKVAAANVQSADQRVQEIEAQLRSITTQYANLPEISAIRATETEAQKMLAHIETQLAHWGEERQKSESERTQMRIERDKARETLSDARHNISTHQAEQKALEKEIRRRDQASSSILHHIDVKPGYEHLLSAALGHELDAALNEGDPAWTNQVDDKLIQEGGQKSTPANSAPLAQYVSAPMQLKARLNHIYIGDKDEGQVLLPGQRLVMRDGTMRRWDGFITQEDGVEVARRLRQRNRLLTLKEQIISLENTLSDREKLFTVKQNALQQAENIFETIRQKRSKLDEAHRQALHERDNAQREKIWHAERQAEAAKQIKASQETLASAQVKAKEARGIQAALPSGKDQSIRRQQADKARMAAAASTQSLHTKLSILDKEGARLREQVTVSVVEIKNIQARADDAEQRIVEMADRMKEIRAQMDKTAHMPHQLQASIAHLSNIVQEQKTQWEEKNRQIEQWAQAIQSKLEARNEAQNAIAEKREDRARAKAHMENANARRSEMARNSGEKFSVPPPLLPDKFGFDDRNVPAIEKTRAHHEHLQKRRDAMGSVNLLAADELNAVETERGELEKEVNELLHAIQQLRGSIGTLNKEGRAKLLTAFTRVNTHYQRLFQELFSGGEAHLSLVDHEDPLEAGLEIWARPPGKKLSSLTLLSGGEQALTAIALIFALFLTNPSPICVLDEVDAPLDDANVERFCDLLDHMVKETDTRYLIVTHNAVTMSRMHRLFGVTMADQGISSLVSVDLTDAEKLVAAE